MKIYLSYAITTDMWPGMVLTILGLWVFFLISMEGDKRGTQFGVGLSTFEYDIFVLDLLCEQQRRLLLCRLHGPSYCLRLLDYLVVFIHRHMFAICSPYVCHMFAIYMPYFVQSAQMHSVH